MDAIILVGGLGTRLRPLTYTRHKSLMPLCNRPAIEYLFSWLAGAGIERAVLAIGQNNDDLAEAYTEGNHCGLRISHVMEHSRLESGGAIRNAVSEANIEGPFLVLNGDVFAEFDLHDALRQHESRRAELSMALYPVDDPSQFGVAALNDDSMITGFVEKPPPGTAPSNLINAGVWIFDPNLVAEIPAGAVRVEETLFPSLVARGRSVHGYQFEGLWADIGTPERYLQINLALARRRESGVVHESAKLEAGATLTASSIGADSTVGARASISESILWENVTVGPGARLEACILADGVEVGAGAMVRGLVAGSGAHVPAGVTVAPGTSLEPGETLGAQ